MANEKRKCKACGLQFYTTDPTKELCHCCEEALKRLNGYAVPVVRCKDCKRIKYWEDGNITCIFWTDQWDMPTAEDAFCSYGERKSS